MKDYIGIQEKDGKIKTMEVVCTFQMRDNDFRYVVYRQENNETYYVAKYQKEGFVDLDTNLSSNELETAKSIMEAILNDKNGM